MQVDGGDDILQLNFMYAVLGGSETGPLLVQPLLFRGRPVGALIAGNGHSKERFGEEAVRLAGALSDLVAQLVIGPRIIGLLEAAMHERDRLAALRQSEWDKRLEALDRDLSQERHSAQLFAQRLVELERGSQQKQSDYDQMARRLMLAEEATRRSQSEAEALARKIDSLARTKMALEDENRGYRRQIAGLEGLLREEPTRLNISVNQPAAAVLHVEDEADVGAEH